MTINQRMFGLLVDGKTQQGLANAIGIGSQNVTGWKQRGTDPPAKLISAISGYLGVSVAFLLTGEDESLGNVVSAPINGSSVVQGVSNSHVFVRNGSEHELSDDAVEMLRVFETLDVRRRHSVLELAWKLEGEHVRG